MPRTFAHAHYAHYDMPVTCLWLLAQVAFLKSLRSSRWIVAFGVLLGLAAGTKLTGWFAVVPPLVWWAVYRRNRRWPAAAPACHLRRPARVAAAAPLARRIAGDAGPGAWHTAGGPHALCHPARLVEAPLWGLGRFLVSNLTREQSVPVTSLYLGTVYRFALPWHNTLVLTAVTTPVVVAGAGAPGIGSTLARARSAPRGPDLGPELGCADGRPGLTQRTGP